jgi:hypothetical protein
VCYSTKVATNTNVQVYLGRRIEVDPLQVLPKDHKVKDQENMISLPYEKYVKDPDEEESFKLLGELVIHNQGSGYTCYVQSYCFFISEKEVKTGKSSIVSLLNSINTIQKFEELGLPIKKVHKCPDGT